MTTYLFKKALCYKYFYLLEFELAIDIFNRPKLSIEGNNLYRKNVIFI